MTRFFFVLIILRMNVDDIYCIRDFDAIILPLMTMRVTVRFAFLFSA